MTSNDAPDNPDWLTFVRGAVEQGIEAGQRIKLRREAEVGALRDLAAMWRSERLQNAADETTRAVLTAAAKSAEDTADQLERMPPNATIRTLRDAMCEETS